MNLKFDTPLVVTANLNSPLDVEFDLSHPAFIVANVPVIPGPTTWAVNFRGPMRHHPIRNVAWLVLRHMYGTVTTVGSTSITINKDYPVYPATNPETALQSSQMLTILADSTNGTLVYDMDAKNVTTVIEFFQL